MSETLAAAILSIVGLVLVAVAFVVLALRTRGQKAVRWRGFGVTFEIRPCVDCKFRRSTDLRREQ